MQAVIRLYREARRRKVFRTTALYVVGAWAVLQAADLTFPGFGIPEAAIRRTPPAAAGEAAQSRPLARRDYALLAAFAAMALTLVYQAVREVRETSRAQAAGDATRPQPVARLANSIAVLPFANISNDPDNEYFCDGISEEILNALSGFQQLNVIGRTSSFAFKGSAVGVEHISAVLGVGHVLQGSVRKAGNDLRISAQLLDGAGRQLWSETFDRQLAKVFDIQSEIAAAVAATVASHVTSRAASGSEPNLEAYDHYLAGRELLHQRSADSAHAELARAIEIDPSFAEAHAEWAIARLIGLISQQELAAARHAIDRALALRPNLLRAQAAKGLWMLQSNPADPAGAEAVLQTVLAQDPNMSDALLWLANAMAAQGREDEQMATLRRAARIDPFHSSVATNLADLFLRRGEIEQGLQVLERQLEQPTPSLRAFVQVRDFHRRNGRLVELNAIAKAQSLRGHLDHPYSSHYSLALGYGLLGDWAAAG